MTINYEQLYLDGRWTSSTGDGRIVVESAATGERIGSVPAATIADVDRAVAGARAAFDDPYGWSTWSPKDRGTALMRLADELDQRRGETLRRVSMQNGMPISIGEYSEGMAPAVLLRYYATIAAEEESEQPRRSLATGTTLVRHDPIGVVAAVVPWNFPQTLTFTKIAPALAAGCTVVIKPSPETVLDAFLLAEAVIEAELPDGVISIVPGGAEIGAALVGHRDVDKVAFTGSTAVGREIGAVCGGLLRPVSLELGGKSAAVLLEDVVLEDMLGDLAAAAFGNNGQTCYLSTRILAPRRRYDEIVAAVTSLAAGLQVGDPLDPATQVGPLVNQRQHDRVSGYVSTGLAEGGRITTGGTRPDGFDRGWYFAPTVFVDVDNKATISQEEIFGPVVSVIPYENEDDAITLANDSPFGLAGTVWSHEEERALDVARRMRTGTVGINGYQLDIGAPFGGTKASGLGRELGPEALAAYRQPQSVYLPRRPWTGG